MKKIILFFLMAAGFISPAFSQRTITDDNAEKRNVGNFHGIDVATGIKLILTYGETEDGGHQQEKRIKEPESICVI
jgi:hypothetical protein